MSMLRWLAARGPWVLVAGILAGLSLPGVAALLVPAIPFLVALLLFLAALRIGPARMRASLVDMPRTLSLVLLMQLVFPLAVIALFSAMGWLNSPFVLALVIIAMAPSISGSPNMVLMMGFDPAVAMRYLGVGTVLLPLTVIPVLYLLPALGGMADVIAAALRLLVVIALSCALAFTLRLTLLREPSRDVIEAIDGASALTLFVVVIGLMSAVNRSMIEAPAEFLAWLAFVCAINFGLQALGYALSRGRMSPDSVAALSVISGNRNVALFLVALPAEVTGPLLVFIGCYQVPMYLTPLVTGRTLQALRL